MPEPHGEKPVPLDYSPPTRPVVPRYRKILAAVLVAAGALLAVLGLFAPTAPVRANIWTTASALFVWGLVIRFQHVRL